MEFCSLFTTRYRCSNTVKNIIYCLVALSIMGLDRITKSWAITLGCKEYIFNKYITFCLTFNRGISWGILNSPNKYIFLIVSLIIICVIMFLAYYTWQEYKKNSLIIFEILTIVGACSNILDRFYYSGVVDFILIHKDDLAWPVFNIADIAIFLGICGMSYRILHRPNA